MNHQTLTRLRPADESAAAIRSALFAIEAEREAARQTIATQTAARTDLLLTGTNSQIRASEDTIRDAEVDVSRLDAMAEALAPQLAEAEQREAADAMAELARVAAAKIAAFNEWLTNHYATHAAALLEGLELERAAWAAKGAVPADMLPEISRAYVGSDARALGFLVRLPGAAGHDPFWWPR